jgi:hypothetical protein
MVVIHWCPSVLTLASNLKIKIICVKGYKPDVTNPQNCKKLVSRFIQLSKQIYFVSDMTVTLTVQCCNLVNFSGTKNKSYFIFNFTLKYLNFSMLWVCHLWLVTFHIYIYSKPASIMTTNNNLKTNRTDSETSCKSNILQIMDNAERNTVINRRPQTRSI